jgi:hypothetical protein
MATCKYIDVSRAIACGHGLYGNDKWQKSLHVAIYAHSYLSNKQPQNFIPRFECGEVSRA